MEMIIRYEDRGGWLLTNCPNGKKFDGRIILVGSCACYSCDYMSQLFEGSVECNFQQEKDNEKV